MNKYLLRSLMFVPGHNERFIRKAAKTDADVLLLDLEDSVQPTKNKQKARHLILHLLEEKIFPDTTLIFPRVNDRESGELLKDLLALSVKGVAGFMYPKSKKGEDVYFFDKLLETIEYEKGIKKGTFKIIPLIETAAAVLNAQEICQSSDRVIAIAYGSEDFIADLGGIHDKEHKSLFVPRATIAMAAKANKVVPIDTVHVNVHDLADLEENLKLSINLGFGGMLVLHPKELDLVHDYYSPDKLEVKEAEEMLTLYAQAQHEDKGVAMINGKFIGPPMVLTAKEIINKNKLIEKKYK